VLLTVAYTLLVGSTAMRVANVTLMRAAVGIVAVSSYRLASEFLTPSLELCMAIRPVSAFSRSGSNRRSCWSVAD